MWQFTAELYEQNNQMKKAFSFINKLLYLVQGKYEYDEVVPDT